MARKHHKPQRTCIICKEPATKYALMRVVRTPDGNVILDSTGKANGRGAYLCARPDCQEKGLSDPRFLSRALKINISHDILTQLRAELSRIVNIQRGK